MRNLTPRAWTTEKGVIREGQSTQYRIKMISRQTQTPTKGQIKTTTPQGGRILFGRADRWGSPYRPEIATTRVYQDVVVPASRDSKGTKLFIVRANEGSNSTTIVHERSYYLIIGRNEQNNALSYNGTNTIRKPTPSMAANHPLDHHLAS
ncbi:hypothetical protein KPH14_007503 [Odynerus spinipes]|uniref:Uncharacterized protein n=1 Tax=Odynerus spinipes TaxID=1348599 RepID=A0AAD9RBW2_9HYME|nr:hypothetical protein KPH14_007503 [Odynerus spinipes]